MTWCNQRKRVGPTSISDSSWTALNFAGDLSVGCSFTQWDLLCRTPYFFLMRCPGRFQRNIKRKARILKIRHTLFLHLFCQQILWRNQLGMNRQIINPWKHQTTINYLSPDSKAAKRGFNHAVMWSFCVGIRLGASHSEYSDIGFRKRYSANAKRWWLSSDYFAILIAMSLKDRFNG